MKVLWGCLVCVLVASLQGWAQDESGETTPEKEGVEDRVAES